MLFEINKIGNNINQIARQVNTNNCMTKQESGNLFLESKKLFEEMKKQLFKHLIDLNINLNG